MTPVPWTPRTTFWWLLGGLLLAIIVPPLVVAPFDPDLDSDGALLAAQAIFDGLLLCVAVGVASDWKFRPLAGPLRLLGLRPFRLNAIWIMLGTLVVYYIAAGLFASLVLKPDQEDIGGELGVGNPSILIADPRGGDDRRCWRPSPRSSSSAVSSSPACARAGRSGRPRSPRA